MLGLPQAPVRRDEYAVYLTNTQTGDRQTTSSSIPTGSVAVPPAESGCSPIRATQWPGAISESELSGGVGQNCDRLVKPCR